MGSACACVRPRRYRTTVSVSPTLEPASLLELQSISGPNILSTPSQQRMSPTVLTLTFGRT